MSQTGNSNSSNIPSACCGVVYSSGYPYDPYGISRNYFGGSNGNSHYYGFQGAQPAYLQQQWFYLGRTGIIFGLPNITQIAPEAALPGTTAVVQVIGSLLGEHTQRPPAFRVSGNGVTARFSNFLPNGVEIFLDIAEDAETGNYDLIILADPHPHDFPAYEGVPSNTVQFRVGDRTPQIAGITPPEGNTGEQVAVTINGTGFGVNPLVQIDGLGVNPTINSATSTEIQATFTVADSTYAGNRGVKIKSNGRLGTGFSPGAGNSDTSNIVNFTVAKPRIEIEPFDSLESYGKRNVKITIFDAKPNSTFRAFIKQGSNSGGVVFDQNSQAGIDIMGNGVKILKIKSLGYTSSQVNDWTLSVEGSGANPQSETFTVSTVIFEEETVCSGFDNVEVPNQLMVPQNNSNNVKIKILPNGATGNFRLEGSEQNGVTASPNSITGEQLITVNAGNITGEYTLQALGTESTQAANTLKVAVRKRINKTVVIHAVTEDNDDVQSILVGQGESNQIAIEASGLKLFSTQAGDDQRVQVRNSRGQLTFAINTGVNGIRETVLSGTDIEKIPLNQGKANSACVKSGTNQERDTNKNPSNDDNVTSDAQNIEYIDSGSKGICETEANNTDVSPNEVNIPSAQSLEQYLNDTTWGKQANVYFTVTRDNALRQVNFDLNRDRLLEYSLNSFSGEFSAISSKFRDPGFDVNLYYQEFDMSTYSSRRTEAVYISGSIWLSQQHLDSSNNLAAHEIGHAIGRTGHNPVLGTLMNEFGGVPGYLNPCRILKQDWDLITE